MGSNDSRMTQPPAGSADRPAIVLPVAGVERAMARSRSNGPWSIEHLRICWWWLGGATVLSAIITGLAVGMAEAVSVILGMVIVGLFFTLSTWFVAKIGAAMPEMALAAALGIYLTKIVALGIVIILFPTDGYISPRWMAIAIVIGLFAWLAAHLRYAATAKVFYTDPGV